MLKIYCWSFRAKFGGLSGGGQWAGGGQNLEWRNVEWPVFRNLKIVVIKIKKDELFDNFIFELFFHFLEIIWTPKIFKSFRYCKILIFHVVRLKKLLNIRNCWILKIHEFLKLNNYSNFGKLASVPN